MKIISFSLWGTNPKYTVGAIKNAKLAKDLYPDWVCRFYCASDVPNPIIFQLEEIDDTEVVLTNKQGCWKFATERFLAIDDNDVEAVMFRDTDSRLNIREKEAVNEWLASGATLHIMKDHPWHGGFPILAGMWGMKTKNIKIKMSQLMQKYKNTDQYHYDQIFLKDYVWPLYNNDFIAHDTFFLKKPFPSKRRDLDYVGKPFNADDSVCLPNADKVLLETLKWKK